MKLNWIAATVTAAAPSETSASVRMPIGLLVRSRLMPIAFPAAVAALSRISASCHSMFMRKTSVLSSHAGRAGSGGSSAQCCAFLRVRLLACPPVSCMSERRRVEKKSGRSAMRAWVRTATLGVALAFAATSAPAQTYPSKPITLVIGYTPGAVSDLAARTLSDGLNQAWGQPVIVDNRPGRGSNIAPGYVARAPADVYTLMVGTDATLTSNVYLYKHTPFDPVKDFAPIINAGANIICLAVNADLPIKTVADLIAYAKKKPGKLSYGTSGVGSPHHLSGELLHQKAGIEITHIPYKGGGAAANDLLARHIG